MPIFQKILIKRFGVNFKDHSFMITIKTGERIWAQIQRKNRSVWCFTTLAYSVKERVNFRFRVILLLKNSPLNFGVIYLKKFLSSSAIEKREVLSVIFKHAYLNCYCWYPTRIHWLIIEITPHLPPLPCWWILIIIITKFM